MRPEGSKTKRRGDRPVARGVWSGSITFGLVTVPIELYSIARPAKAALRMLAADGTPLARIYVSANGKPLADDEIERGYEIAKERFVLVSDAELEKLAPRRSRDIELTHFVAKDAIAPEWFVRPYLALPGGEQAKAYRLLAETMEASGRAAIATFVMRGKAQAAAVFAERGLLRIETLRFGDEVRDPARMGIPKAARADTRAVQAMTRALGALKKSKLDADELEAEEGSDLLELARKKLARGKDVVRVPEAAAADADEDGEEQPGGAEAVDLFRLIEQRLRSAPATRRAKRHSAGGLSPRRAGASRR